MKKIILSALILICLKSVAQTDSTKISVQIQARDWNYVGSFMGGDFFEMVFDDIKTKFRVVNPPSGLTTVQCDSGYILHWVAIDAKLMYDPVALRNGVFLRVDAVLRALNNVFLTAKLDGIDAGQLAQYNQTLLIGRNKLRKL